MSNKQSDNSYRSILKGSSILGGTQMLHVLISLLRGKFVAMLLGPAGMGVNSLYTSSAEMIEKFASLGLNLAFVKEIAASNDDPEKVREIYCVAKRMIYLTAIAGALICMLGASFLSRFTFGDTDHYPGMMLLGLVVFFTIAWRGEMSVLQGLHKVRILSKATIVGSLAGLCLGVPLLWLFGTRGIVPSMLVLAVVMLAFYSHGVRRSVGKTGVRFLWQKHKPMVLNMMTMGFVLMSTDLIASGCSYLLDVYIRWTGQLESVGLWRSANSLTMQYAGVIFSTMALDYFPRLSAAIGRNDDFDGIVNRQTEIVTLVMLPLGCLLMIFAPLVVRLLLDESFVVVIPLLKVFAMALIVRGAMYPVGYVLLAKNDKKLYFWLEGVGCNLLTYGLIAVGFTLFGLIGIGVAMVADNMIVLIIYIIVNRRMYGFRFSREAAGCILWSILAGGSCLAASALADPLASYTLMSLLAALGIAVAVRGLRRRLRRSTPE